MSLRSIALLRFLAPLYLMHLPHLRADDPVRFAISQLGVPYLEAASSVGPDYFDCSGLTKTAFSHIGITLPHKAAIQAQLGQAVPGQLQPGDLIFFNTFGAPGVVTHVGIFVSGTTMVDANSVVGHVTYDDLTAPYWVSHFLFARRYLAVRDLGSLGSASATAYGINNNGQVVGSSGTGQYGGGGATCGNGQCPISHAFLWGNGVMTDLGLPPGAFGIDSAGQGINSNGQIVGTYTYPAYFGGSFLYSGGLMRDLQGIASNAYAINSGGDVAGSVSTNGEFSPYHAFLYSGGTTIDLGTFGGSSSEAYAINDSGQAVGQAALGGNSAVHAFLYSAAQPLRDLGTLGGLNSVALGINRSGQVVGWSNTNSGVQHAFLYNSSPMQDLGTLGGTNSRADALNKNGQIVGWSITASGEQHAFLWNAGEMIDLNGLFALGQGALLVEATSINDVGQIVANGNNGHAYVLSLPSPVPPVIMLSSNGTASLGQAAPFPVNLSAPAPAGGITLSLTSSNTSKLTVTPVTVTIAAGATSPAVLPQMSGINLGTATITVSAPGFVPVSQQVRVTAVVYSQTSYNSSNPNACMVVSINNGAVVVGACGPFVQDWFEPTGNPPGKLASITLKLQVQSTSEYQAWNCPGFNCGSPGDFGAINVYSTQIQNGCTSTNFAKTTDYLTPDIWRDFTFTFDSNCPIDFSQGNQIWNIQRAGGVPFGWGMAFDTSGQIYAIIRSQ